MNWKPATATPRTRQRSEVTVEFSRKASTPQSDFGVVLIQNQDSANMNLRSGKARSASDSGSGFGSHHHNDPSESPERVPLLIETRANSGSTVNEIADIAHEGTLPGSTLNGGTFKRNLGAIEAFGIVISIVIGSGVFTSPGSIDTNVPSPGVALLVWLVGGVLAWTGASTMAELGTAIAGEGKPICFWLDQ